MYGAHAHAGLFASRSIRSANFKITQLKFILKGKSLRKLAYKNLFRVKSLKASVEFIHPIFSF